VPNILVWNVDNRDLRPFLCELVSEYAVDLLVLIENTAVSEKDTCETLCHTVSRDFKVLNTECQKVQFYSNRAGKFDLSEVHGNTRWSIRKFASSSGELLLGFVHLIDKWNNSIWTQSEEVRTLVTEILAIERRFGHSRTIVAGDFNLNPYEEPLVHHSLFNAMMTQECVKRGSRTVQFKDYAFFYNPMWGLFGDGTDGPAGTFYHTRSGDGSYGWNMLDQVLVRPKALDQFREVRILSLVGETSLCSSQGRPNVSDHLPILFSIE